MLSTSPHNVCIANLQNPGGPVYLCHHPAAFRDSSGLQQHAHTGIHVYPKVPQPTPSSPHQLQCFWPQLIVDASAKTPHAHRAQQSQPAPLHSDSEGSDVELPQQDNLSSSPHPASSFAHPRTSPVKPSPSHSFGTPLLRFNLMRVEIRELRPKYLVEVTMDWFTTQVEPIRRRVSLLRPLYKEIERWESTYSGSEDLWYWGLNYILTWDSEDAGFPRDLTRYSGIFE